MASRSSNEVIEPRLNFEEIPLSALTKRTKEKLSVLLNPEKVLPSEDGHSRDWRGIFSLSGLTQSEYALISQSDDKTSKLLDLWTRKNIENDVKVNLSQLQQCFEIIDRYDVYDDTMSLFSDDAKVFLTKPKNSDVKNRSSFEIMRAEPDNDIITMKDVECNEKGLSLPIYDALVIYNDKDIEFATELIERLENIGYLLCAKDRDLLPGLSFESDAMLNLLSKRCNRLIIIVSKAFLSSPMQIFITNFAQALGIEQGNRKIIPCLLEPCDLPQMLRFCFRLDYYRNNKLFDFWDKLDKSLKVNKREITSQAEAVKINEKNPVKNSSPPATLVYKFSDAPLEMPEKSKNHSSMKKSPEPEQKTQKIWPPQPKLRAASSMVSLNTIPNGNGLQYKNKLSKSSFFLNGNVSMNGEFEESSSSGSSSKLKRKKWYSIFLPPKEAKIKVKIEEECTSMTKEKKPKRKWFKNKNKRDKTAIAL